QLLLYLVSYFSFFFLCRRQHTRSKRDWSSDVCSSDLFISLIFLPSSTKPICLYKKIAGVFVENTPSFTFSINGFCSAQFNNSFNSNFPIPLPRYSFATIMPKDPV